jgi:LDH2 family malate/lactate/ureidoglycolate dehydrogenase
MYFSAAYLREFAAAIFRHFGVGAAEAELAADVLVKSDLRGIDSHGREGRDTTNPQDMIDGGAQLPLGSEREMGGHKGYALASMVDILYALLSGANWGPFAPPFALRGEIPERSVGKGIGHFFGSIEIDGFIDKDEFKKQIDDWIHVFRKTKPAPGTNGR